MHELEREVERELDILEDSRLLYLILDDCVLIERESVKSIKLVSDSATDI